MTMKTLLGAATALAILAAPAAMAQDAALTEAHIQLLDMDGDGAIDVTEYRVYTSNAFIALDTDNDDALKPADTEKAMPESLFKEMDKDADGIVTRVEYDARMMLDFNGADKDKNGKLD